MGFLGSLGAEAASKHARLDFPNGTSCSQGHLIRGFIRWKELGFRMIDVRLQVIVRPAV